MLQLTLRCDAFFLLSLSLSPSKTPPPPRSPPRRRGRRRNNERTPGLVTEGCLRVKKSTQRGLELKSRRSARFGLLYSERPTDPVGESGRLVAVIEILARSPQARLCVEMAFAKRNYMPRKNSLIIPLPTSPGTISPHFCARLFILLASFLLSFLLAFERFSLLPLFSPGSLRDTVSQVARSGASRNYSPHLESNRTPHDR